MSRYDVKRHVIECDSCHSIDVTEDGCHKHKIILKELGWWLPSGRAYKRTSKRRVGKTKRNKKNCDLCPKCKEKYIDKLRDELGIKGKGPSDSK